MNKFRIWLGQKLIEHGYRLVEGGHKDDLNDLASVVDNTTVVAEYGGEHPSTPKSIDTIVKGYDRLK